MYWLVAFIVRLLPHLPLRWRYRLGYWVGVLAFYLLRQKGAQTVRNQAMILRSNQCSGCQQSCGSCVPEQLWRDAWQAARASWGNYGHYLIEYLGSRAVTIERLMQSIPLPNSELIEETLAQGKGAIFVTCHSGCWDYAPPLVVSRCTQPLWVAADSIGHPRMNDLLQGLRVRLGARSIAVEESGSVRRMLRVLRDNQILALLIDKPVFPDGVPVTMFGQQTMLPGGAATLAILSGSPILLGGVRRVAGEPGSFVGFVECLHCPPLSGNREVDIRAYTQCMANGISKIIAAYPDQWYMFRPFWPAGQLSQDTYERESQLETPRTGDEQLVPV